MMRDLTWCRLINFNFSFWIQTYYVAAPINIMLRFTWVLNIVQLRVNGQMLAIALALLEAYRRIQWNFFRLENEVIIILVHSPLIVMGSLKPSKKI